MIKDLHFPESLTLRYGSDFIEGAPFKFKNIIKNYLNRILKINNKRFTEMNLSSNDDYQLIPWPAEKIKKYKDLQNQQPSDCKFIEYQE